MTVPLRYQGLDYVRDPRKGRSVAEANQEHLVDALSHDEVLGDLRAYLDESMVFDESDFASRFMGRLSDAAWIAKLLDRLASPRFDPVELVPQLKAFEDSYFNVLEIFWHSKISVFLSVVDAERATKFSAPDPNFNVMGFTTYLCFVKGGPARIRIFHVGSGEMRTEDRQIEAGDMVAIRGGRNSMKFLSCDRDLSVIAINILTAESHDVLRYDAATGEVIKRSTNDVDAQRFFLYSTVLRQMQRPDALAAFVRLLDHDEPTLRWHVMREMLALDAQAAAPHLLRMTASDPDEVVRKTARATLERHREVLFSDKVEVGGAAA